MWRRALGPMKGRRKAAAIIQGWARVVSRVRWAIWRSPSRQSSTGGPSGRIAPAHHLVDHQVDQVALALDV